MPVEQPPIGTSRSSKSKPPAQARDDDTMQLDDSKHKVYIYDLDAELSESESDDGKLVFLPDIEKHLRASRIPQSIRANSEGELAGNKQLVLYNIPSSLTVPEEQDSVRKAIIEARARARAGQGQTTQAQDKDTEIPDGSPSRPFGHHGTSGEASSTIPSIPEADEYDPDAMDLG